MNVLVVDDEILSVELLKQALTTMGYQVSVRENGSEALAYLRDHGDCRIMITDWEMPDIDGLELTRRVRQESLGHYVYIIMVTSRGGTANVVEGLEAGADDFMSKPFHPAELEVRLRSGLRLMALEASNMTIFALAKLAESRDPETGAHLERVRGYSRALAAHMASNSPCRHEIDATFIENIYLTAPLHDIGKVAIPDHVLLKPGRLTDAEFEIMKRHTTEGAATLNSVLEVAPHASFLKVARDIALCHHERYDGTGYPRGLKGTDIPLSARIFSVADVYDALISKRVYKSAFSHDVAKSLIMEGDGTQFDSQVVAAFLALETTFQTIVKTQAEP
ncbi:HD domain-containing phosphohydrolase [Desulfoluna sp.]|uniref:response regulator n=1 Tax=Desulfoluna sp. TaxID=2045199 RepID=UPI0026061DE6|nr:HD domain-containing phosphohydrolase [Desulfoluna sp.]